MVFVHARNATVRTAMALREKAKNNGHICHFLSPRGSEYGQAEKRVSEYFALIVFSVLDFFYETVHMGIDAAFLSFWEGFALKRHVKLLN